MMYVAAAGVLMNGAIAMLLWHPMDLYSAGFHLSFAVVIAYAILLPLVNQWLLERKGPSVQSSVGKLHWSAILERGETTVPQILEPRASLDLLRSTRSP